MSFWYDDKFIKKNIEIDTRFGNYNIYSEYERYVEEKLPKRKDIEKFLNRIYNFVKGEIQIHNLDFIQAAKIKNYHILKLGDDGLDFQKLIEFLMIEEYLLTLYDDFGIAIPNLENIPEVEQPIDSKESQAQKKLTPNVISDLTLVGIDYDKVYEFGKFNESKEFVWTDKPTKLAQIIEYWKSEKHIDQMKNSEISECVCRFFVFQKKLEENDTQTYYYEKDKFADLFNNIQSGQSKEQANFIKKMITSQFLPVFQIMLKEYWGK